MTVTIRFLETTDFEPWHRLWDAYCAFYETAMPAEVTEVTWRRLLAENEPNYCGLVAERDGEVVGIANCILHHTTWAAEPRCYVNDLYVDESARGSGAGRALIMHIQDLAARNNWDKVHWLTHESNTIARALYDQFAPATGFIQYAVPPRELP